MKNAEFIEFTAQTKNEWINLADGTKIRKGAINSIVKMVETMDGKTPTDLE